MLHYEFLSAVKHSVFNQLAGPHIMSKYVIRGILSTSIIVPWFDDFNIVQTTEVLGGSQLDDCFLTCH